MPFLPLLLLIVNITTSIEYKKYPKKFVYQYGKRLLKMF